ncbi:MAG: ApbE family lipoprotein [Candidatus Saccharibacteria bacterium]|nr:ApbE family lipoprotein [Candidatus Saccharibacteria bacterium]
MLPHNYLFEAIGTKWNIATATEIDTSLKKVIQDRIETFDRTYSRFRSDSLVTRLAKKEGEYEFPKDAAPLFDFYKKLYELTDGRMTPLIGEMLERAGYDAKYSLQAREQTSLPEWEDVMEVKESLVRTRARLTIDIGAAGKGYLVDIIAALLNDAGYKEYVIDASGDFIHKGKSENRVGLEHPLQPGQVIGVVDVRNQSMCASASNRRAWGEGMHHIFDPTTKAPVKDVIATWVIADQTMIADGLATALFFADPSLLAQYFEYQYVRMYHDGSLDYSYNFRGELF